MAKGEGGQQAEGGLEGHRHDGVHLARHSLQEDRVGGERPADILADLGDQLGHRGTDDVDFFGSEDAAVAVVGVQAGDGDAWVLKPGGEQLPAAEPTTMRCQKQPSLGAKWAAEGAKITDGRGGRRP